MIKGKSLVVGSIVAALFVLGGGSQANAAGSGSAGDEALQAKVERQMLKMEATNGRPADSVLCKRRVRRDWDSGSGTMKAFKCRIRYDFGSDFWEWAFWEPSLGHISVMESIGTPWYNGNWYVDCRQTEARGFCLKLGKRQMRGCMDTADDRGYCHTMVYGTVNLNSGKAPRGANPVIVSTKADASDLRDIVGSGGCYPREGEMPPCAPDGPVRVELPEFTTGTEGIASVRGSVEVTGEQIGPDPDGTARVSVRIVLDDYQASEPRTVEVKAGEAIAIPVESRFTLPAGEHRVYMEITGSGFDYVNVKADSARLKVFATHPRNIR